MKYRFRPSKVRLPVSSRSAKKIYRLRGRDKPRTLSAEPIFWTSLFEMDALCAPTSPKRKKKRGQGNRRWLGVAKRLACALPRGLTRLFRFLGRSACRLTVYLQKKRSAKVIEGIPVLCGILCAALLVTALSAGGVLLALLLPYHRPYTSVTVPDFVGSSVPNWEEDHPIELILQYEYNPQVTPGTVISQTPHAGVTRRIYERDGSCAVLLRVSRERDPYLLESLIGMSRRDALLTLTNHGVEGVVLEEHSDDFSANTVIATLPEAGVALKEGSTVTLRISAGPLIQKTQIPDLRGMSESAADALLRALGLATGSVTYRASSLPAGTVLDQSPAAYKEVDAGVSVSYTVSSGNVYQAKTVPDLYGMSRGEAEAILRAYGLVVGDCFPVASAAPKGTVITQSPVAGTPITSSTVSVNLYLSS